MHGQDAERDASALAKPAQRDQGEAEQDEECEEERGKGERPDLARQVGACGRGRDDAGRERIQKLAASQSRLRDVGGRRTVMVAATSAKVLLPLCKAYM